MIDNSEKSRLLNWLAFEIKSDSPARDFEALCRSLVRLSLCGDGRFTGFKQQAGVEFAIEVTREGSTLGPRGTVVGWQCKYFRGRVYASRYKQIEDSYKKTLKHYPNITKWILWTPECLSPSEQTKIIKLCKKGHTIKEIVFWHDDTILALASILPRTGFLHSYFGQYSFVREELRDALEDSMIPVLDRWKKGAHCADHGELLIRKTLFEAGTWKEPLECVNKIEGLIEDLGKCRRISGRVQLIHKVKEMCNKYERIFEGTKDGHIIDTTDKLQFAELISEIERVRKTAYYSRNHAHFILQNLVHYIRLAEKNLNEAVRLVGNLIIAVKSPPGGGKTHLCLSLASPTAQRPAGILFLAKTMCKGETLDEFIRSQSFAGRTFENVDSLLNALDTVGCKNGCLIPLIIDGLNESQEPAEWADKIELIRTKLRRTYHNVRVVVTMRCPSTEQKYEQRELDYDKICLPPGIQTVKIVNQDFAKMLQKYLNLYNIKLSGRIPYSIESTIVNPLFIRVFCDANKDRAISAVDFLNEQECIPLWLKTIGSRICNGSGVYGYHSEAEFYKAALKFAELLWERNDRAVPVEQFDKYTNCSNKEYKTRWSWMLANEGMLMRFHHKDTGEEFLEGLHDIISGFVVARYLMECSKSDSNIFKRLNKKRHPLEIDIITSLIPMWMAKYPQKNILAFIPKRLLPWAIKQLLYTPRQHCPADTLSSIRQLVECKDELPEAKNLIFRTMLMHCMATDKAFNGEELENCLSRMDMAARDFFWGSWVYQMRDDIHKQLADMCEKADIIKVSEVKSMFACCKWLCSSIVIPIRDLATQIICKIGERFPKEVLELIACSLDVNDEYVLERLVAAAYGICVAIHNKSNDAELAKDFAKELENKILCSDAAYPTSHYGVLNYAINTLALATNNRRTRVRIIANPFAKCARVTERNIGEASFALRGDIDFVLKDLAHLAGGHDNQTETKEYKRILKNVQKRIFALGYRDQLFRQFDERIKEGKYRTDNKMKVSGFGKKYAKIAYMEMKGVLDKKVNCWGRWYEVSLDPTFPEKPRPFPKMESVALFGSKFTTMRQWVFGGYCPKLERIVCGRVFPDSDEEWVLVDGFLTADDSKARSVFAIVKGFLAEAANLNTIKKKFCNLRIRGREFYCAFHGEAPWSLNWRDEKYGADSLDLQLQPEIVLDPALKDNNGGVIAMETFAVHYNWASYHTPENNASGALLGAYFAQEMNLTLVPHKWEYVDQGGKVAARFCSCGDASMRYRLLYVRKDLIKDYSDKRGMPFFVGYWGERQVHYKELEKHREIYKAVKLGTDKFIRMLNPLKQSWSNLDEIYRHIDCLCLDELRG